MSYLKSNEVLRFHKSQALQKLDAYLENLISAEDLNSTFPA